MSKNRQFVLDADPATIDSDTRKAIAGLRYGKFLIPKLGSVSLASEDDARRLQLQIAFYALSRAFLEQADGDWLACSDKYLSRLNDFTELYLSIRRQTRSEPALKLVDTVNGTRIYARKYPKRGRLKESELGLNDFKREMFAAMETVRSKGKKITQEAVAQAAYRGDAGRWAVSNRCRTLGIQWADLLKEFLCKK